MGISVLASLGEREAALSNLIWIYPLGEKDEGARKRMGWGTSFFFPVLLPGELSF